MAIINVKMTVEVALSLNLSGPEARELLTFLKYAQLPPMPPAPADSPSVAFCDIVKRTATVLEKGMK